MTQKTTQNPWTMDVRVRERNLKSGALTDKDLEKYLSGLPDVAEQSEAFGTSQPALAQPVVEPEPEVAPVVAEAAEPAPPVATFEAPAPAPQEEPAPAASPFIGGNGFGGGEGEQP